jgi:hypothetical protein
MQFSPISYNFIPFRSKYSSQHPLLKYPQVYFVPLIIITIIIIIIIIIITIFIILIILIIFIVIDLNLLILFVHIPDVLCVM